MRKFSSQLWPIRYKPLPGELLSCWLVRLAHGHGMKAQTFCNIVFGGRQIWNRDIDRLAPQWLLDELAIRTGTPAATVLNTTLRSYEAKLYPKFHSAGILNGMLVLQMYHRKRRGYGLQFCPDCLADDEIPYFRKRWRVAFYTFCTNHGTLLLDRCPKCNMPIAAHRIDMQKKNLFLIPESLSLCHSCGRDLRNAPKTEPQLYRSTERKMHQLCDSLENDRDEKWNLASFSTMRQLCTIMTARYEHAKLRSFVLEQLESNIIQPSNTYSSFETRPIEDRHDLTQLALWLLDDLQPRLAAAWHASAIRYNLFLKGFHDPPASYIEIVEKFANWRDRIK